MFSKYEEISKMIRAYIEDSLTHITGDIKMLEQQIEDKYQFTLSVTDTTNLTNAISIAKETRSNYNNALQNSNMATTDWANALNKSKELAVSKEGIARSYAYSLATKICIGTYKGPLTMDTMKELKEHEYDGTYGSTTMMQMYSMYTQSSKLIERATEAEATVEKQKASISQYEQAYRNQYVAFQNEQNKVKALSTENENLKTQNNDLLLRIGEQTNQIQVLSDRIDALSKKWSTQVMETLKGFTTQMQEQRNIRPIQNNTVPFPSDTDQKAM